MRHRKFPSVLCLVWVWTHLLVAVYPNTALANEEEHPAEAAAAPSAVNEKEEDSIRLRVRKRLEEPPKLGAGVKTQQTGSQANEAALKELWEKLQKEKKELEVRTQELNRREQSLKEREALAKAQLSRYEQTLTDLRGEVNGLRGLRDTKLDEFRRIYSKMESKKAARILDDMDTDLAGQILSSLKESQSAEILAQMDPERARRITARFLTGRSFGQYKPH